MIKIIKDGTSLGMTEAPTYVRQAENGCFVLCREAEATGIAHNGTVYHLLGREALEGAESVILEAADAGAEIQAAGESAANNAKLSGQLSAASFPRNTSRPTGRVCWRCTGPLTRPTRAPWRTRSRGCTGWTAPRACTTPITPPCTCARPI